MSNVKMKYADLAAVAQRGVLSVDNSSLEVEDGYKVFRTLRALKEAAKSFDDQKTEIIKSRVSEEELGKAQAYEKAEDKAAEGLMSKADYEKFIAKLNEANRLVAKLVEDEVEVEVRPVSFKSYFALKKANKDVLKTDMDMVLEGVMWQDGEGREAAGDEPAAGAE